ncbi:MAG: hypothetical protein LAO30_07385 [Acidobacteriia bacterium]|nr:hypothetical protein [Terriglobia bacterium]
MSNDKEKNFDLSDTADHLKNDPKRGEHLPTMPDPVHDPERGQRLPAEPDPSKRPTPIHELGRLDEEEGDETPEKVA